MNLCKIFQIILMINLNNYFLSKELYINHLFYHFLIIHLLLTKFSHLLHLIADFKNILSICLKLAIKKYKWTF